MLVAEMEDQYLDQLDDEDFVGVQCYTKIQLGPEGLVAPTGETTEMGYLYWPQCVEYTARKAARRATDVPIIITENGIGTNDDDQRIRYLTEALRGVSACSTTASTCAATSSGRCSTTSNGPSATARSSASSRSTVRPSPGTAKPSAQWYSEATKNFPDGL
jgi:hypothetical protein